MRIMRTYAHAPWQFSRGCCWYNSDKTNCSKVISWGLISHGNEFGDKKMRKHLCCCVSSRCLSVLLIMISGDRGEDCILSCQFVNECYNWYLCLRWWMISDWSPGLLWLLVFSEVSAFHQCLSGLVSAVGFSQGKRGRCEYTVTQYRNCEGAWGI